MELKRDKVILKIPSRFHLNVLNIQKMNIGSIGGGGIGLGIDMNTYITIRNINFNQDIVDCDRQNVVKYYLKLLKEKFEIKENFEVKVKFDTRLKMHNGMASNVVIQSGIVYGMNYLLGEPMSKTELIEQMEQNYCEEIDKEITKNTFCSGVAHNTVIYGGLCFIDQDGKLLYTKKMPSNTKLLIAKATFGDIFKEANTDQDENIVRLRKENDNNYYYKKIKVLKKDIIPDLKKDNFTSLARKMREFSREDDSSCMCKICKINQMTYDEVFQKLSNIENLIMGVASNSPYVYIITNNVKKVKNTLGNIEFLSYDISNSGIKSV